jgi:hypothetical protein
VLDHREPEWGWALLEIRLECSNLLASSHIERIYFFPLRLGIFLLAPADSDSEGNTLQLCLSPTSL